MPHPSSRAPPSRFPPLARAPFPADGEHFGSWVRRLAADNGMRSLGPLAARLDLVKVTAQSGDRAWNRLIEATGLAAERLDPLRIRTDGSRRSPTTAFGQDRIQVSFLDHARLRSCPSCLARDGSLPVRFALRQAPACTEHGTALSDACACGRGRRIFDLGSFGGRIQRMSDYGSPWDCPGCGRAPSRLPVEPADPREILASRFVLGRDGAEALPPALLREPLGARAALVERLGRLAMLERDDTPRSSRYNIRSSLPDSVPKDRTIADDRASATAAGELLADWPAAYHALFERLLDRHPHAGAKDVLARHFSSEAGRLAIRAFVDHEGRPIAAAEEARLAFLRDRVGHVPASKNLLSASSHYGTMPGTPRGTTDLAQNKDNFVTAAEFAERVHVGDKGHIGAWFEAGAVRTVRHADGSVLLARSDLDELVARFAALPEGDGGRDHVPAAVANNHRGALYRQRHFIEDVLSGRIRSRAADDGSEGMRSRLIDRADFERRRLLCRTAIQIIGDDFAKIQRRCVFRALWDKPIPTERTLARLADGGEVRWVPGASSRRYAVRDIVNIMQRETGVILFRTDVPEGLAETDWPTILIEADSL